MNPSTLGELQANFRISGRLRREPESRDHWRHADPFRAGHPNQVAQRVTDIGRERGPWSRWLSLITWNRTSSPRGRSHGSRFDKPHRGGRPSAGLPDRRHVASRGPTGPRKPNPRDPRTGSPPRSRGGSPSSSRGRSPHPPRRSSGEILGGDVLIGIEDRPHSSRSSNSSSKAAPLFVRVTRPASRFALDTHGAPLHVYVAPSSYSGRRPRSAFDKGSTRIGARHGRAGRPAVVAVAVASRASPPRRGMEAHEPLE